MSYNCFQFPRSSWHSQETSHISHGEVYRPRDVSSPAGRCLPRGACDKFSPVYGTIRVSTNAVAGPEDSVVVTVVLVVSNCSCNSGSGSF